MNASGDSPLVNLKVNDSGDYFCPRCGEVFPSSEDNRPYVSYDKNTYSCVRFQKLGCMCRNCNPPRVFK